MFFTPMLGHYKRLAPTVEEMAAKDFKDGDSEVTKLHNDHHSSALSRMLLDNQHIRMVMRKMLVSRSGFIEMLRRFLMRSLLQPS